MARHVGVRATAHAIGRATRLDAEVALVVLRRPGDGVGFTRTLQNLIEHRRGEGAPHNRAQQQRKRARHGQLTSGGGHASLIY